MIWDKVAGFYDLVENLYNGKVYGQLGKQVSAYIEKDDFVLECACGTGILSVEIAENCRKLISTDCSTNMLKRAKRKCRHLSNIRFAKADISKLRYQDNQFDKVVAANVIHLLDSPEKALQELERVCKAGGKIIVPTYVNKEKRGAGIAVGILERIGIVFKRQFHYSSYKKFFQELGYVDCEYVLIEGRMPCAIAVITKNKDETYRNG